MRTNDSIGVVGHGFVGRAMQEGMMHAFRVFVYDTKYDNSPTVPQFVVDSLHKLCVLVETVFVCVPTPMNADGSCNTSIVETVIKQINDYGCDNIVVIKSTVPPGTTERLAEQNPLLRGIVFNPEFLTEANYLDDFKTQSRIILGGEEPAKSIVKQLYDKSYPRASVIKTSSTIAEMVKYMTNTFLATKVSFANEMYQICQALGIDYDKVIEYARYDERLGNSHWKVPGPDGKGPGFGLSCFPKDLNALIHRASELGVAPTVMKAVWEKNLEVRIDRDWERMAKAVTTVKGNK